MILTTPCDETDVVSAAFHDEIRNALPQIITWLTESDWDVPEGAATIIGKLAERGR
jgi:hypothetical protein